MKAIKFLSAVFAALTLASCVDLDENKIQGNANISGITVYGKLVSDPLVEYSSVIDSANYTITIQVPYYLSDTEPVQGDLTKMTLRANLPQGATFNPSIAGQHDLLSGFKTTLKYADGGKIDFTILAAYVKSDVAMLSSLKSADPNVAVSVVVSQPTEPGGKGKIMTQMSVSAMQALKKCVAVVSPWATIEGDAVSYDENLGKYCYDFTSEKDLIVVSQSGKVRTAYTPVFETPETVEYGVGHIESMWAFQATNENPHGFQRDCQQTMAVVGDYLLVSNATWDKLTKTGELRSPLVYNRYNGEYLEDVKVNLEGIDSTRELRAITTDDAGHFVGMTFVSKKDMDATAELVGREYYTTDRHVNIYVWKDGITSAPTQLCDLLFTGEGAVEFAGLKTGNIPTNLGNTISVKGDLTSGEAAAMSFYPDGGRVTTFRFTDGVFQQIFAQCPTVGTTLTWVGGWYGTKCIPTEVNDTFIPYYFCSSTEGRYLGYMTSNNIVKFDIPTTNFWGTDTYNHWTIGMDVIEFNGAKLMAIQNVLRSNGVMASRLYLSDITQNPIQSSFADGFIFDSRENNGSPLGTVIGTGYSPTGMLSTQPFSGDETAIGTENNAFKRGDVVFARTSDPNEIHVYMMYQNAGILAYKIQAYDL